MAFRFHRSIKILPGIRLNLSKSGIGVSLGVKGYRLSFGPSGIRRTVSIPGTGISHIDQLYHLPKENSRNLDSENSRNLSSITSTSSNILPFSILGLLCLILIGGISFLFSLYANEISHPQPKNNIDSIVSTTFAKYTQQALINQIFGEYTQTAVKAQFNFNQTQAAIIIPSATLAHTATSTLSPPEITCTPTIEPIPILPLILDTVMPIQPTIQYLPGYLPPTQENAPIKTCCKMCNKGKACGNSCISRKYTCHQPPGCACNY